MWWLWLIALLLIVLQSRNVKIPKIIWTYWHSDDRPKLVEKCIESWRKHNPDWDIRVLSDTTVHQWLPGFDHNGYDLQAHKSDMIRLMLIDKYGGVWSDASVALREPLQLPDIEFVGYYREDRIIENFWFAAPPGSEFVSRWLKEFQKCRRMGHETYVTRADVDMTGIPDPKYLAAYVAALAVLKKFTNDDLKYRFYFRRVEDGPYKHAIENNWEDQKSVQWLCNSEKLPGIIKFHNGHRKTIENSNLNCVFTRTFES
jgi:hypothetical protein